jgi:hypothetical protein
MRCIARTSRDRHNRRTSDRQAAAGACVQPEVTDGTRPSYERAQSLPREKAKR